MGPDPVRVSNGAGCRLVLDVRGCTPSIRRDIVVFLVDKLLELDAADSLVVICEHEPVGLGYGIDLRKETRGRFEYFYDRRTDGAWVALIRRKPDDASACDIPLRVSPPRHD